MCAQLTNSRQDNQAGVMFALQRFGNHVAPSLFFWNDDTTSEYNEFRRDKVLV
jgi:hypothetical protein